MDLRSYLREHGEDNCTRPVEDHHGCDRFYYEDEDEEQMLMDDDEADA